jgi:excinuclease ABC subunit A
VLYVLDEPSIGLHQRDNARLLDTLRRLRDLGNTVIVVEHDRETIAAADHVVDFGPGAGVAGGEVVYAGGVPGLRRSACLTGKYLSGRLEIPVPARRRPGNGQTIRITGAREHNLKDVMVTLPLGTLIAVTGVSGAGKSTLVNAILYPALKRALYASHEFAGAHDTLTGIEHVDKVIDIDHARSDGRRVATRPPIPSCSTRSATSSRSRRRRAPSATRRGASRST